MPRVSNAFEDYLNIVIKPLDKNKHNKFFIMLKRITLLILI